MTRRRRKKNKFNKIVLLFSILFSFIVLLFFVQFIKQHRYFFKKLVVHGGSWVYNSGVAQNKNVNFYIWKIINFIEWTIYYKPVYWYYFFQLKSSTDWKFFWLRSDKYILSNYSWKLVKIKWKIVDFYWNTPIIYVNELISENSISSGYVDTWTNKKQNIYKVLQYWLTFNFDNQTGWKVDIQKNKIFVYFSWDEVAEIDAFLCNTWSGLYNCKKIYNDFKNLNFENFVSSNGMKYFHISESDTWFTTNDFVWWYYITPKDSNILYKLSSYIFPYKIEKLKKDLLSIVWNVCKNEMSYLVNIKSLSIVSSWNNLVWILKWIDNNNENVICKIVIRFEWWIPIINLINYDFVKNSGFSSNFEKIKVSSWSYIITNFTHGFNVKIPSKNVVYKQIFKKTDLWIENLNCDYRVLIVNWKDKGKLDTDPDIVVYRCKWDFSKQDLEKLLNDYIIVKWNSNYYYVIKYKSNYKYIAEGLEIVR